MAGKYRTMAGKLVLTREAEVKMQKRIAFVLLHGQNSDRLPLLKMRRDECIKSACSWWERFARHELPTWREERDVPMSEDPENEDFHKSGIQHGRPWDDLTNVEKVKISTSWFYHIALQHAGILEEIDTSAERTRKEAKVGATQRE